MKDAKCIAEIRHISFFKGETVVKIYDQPMGEEIWFEIEDLELLQYTGLKDKNGVEIYEGDIIRYFSEVMSKKEWICSVEVIGATFAVRTGKKSYMDGSFLNRLSKDEKLEIIGNIYENPELLEETK